MRPASMRAMPSTSLISVSRWRLSADAIPAQIDALLAAGAKPYVTKPLEIKPFLELVREHLKAGTPQSTEQAA